MTGHSPNLWVYLVGQDWGTVASPSSTLGSVMQKPKDHEGRKESFRNKSGAKAEIFALADLPRAWKDWILLPGSREKS